ncbi:MAG: site-specific DNA-methyltransferase [Eubacterium sp.]|nr:site-specific DNA-methyltransferase [Eubacterium sp.]
MDKLRMGTKDMADENFKKLQELFPNAVTETIVDGEVVRAIDKDILQQEISAFVVDGPQERYQFTWPDKRNAVRLASEPINKTLRPCREESVDFDNTENLYIEGDNLDVLKLLQETYLGKVKMIYIDPPYNTGNDFVYNDSFDMSADEYSEVSGEFDEENNRLVQNTESNGRYHTDWLNMLYPRLKVAKNLLSDDGVIFISIDDREQENLKKLCNEVFGEQNCVGVGQWRRVEGKPGKAASMARTSEFVLIYAKAFGSFNIGKLPLSNEGLKEFRYSDEKGRFRRGQIFYPNRGIHHYSVESPYGNTIEGDFTIKESFFRQFDKEKKIYWAEQGEHTPYLKIYLSDFEGVMPTNTFGKEFGSSQFAVKEFKKIFGTEAVLFDNPKPTKLINRLLLIANLNNDSIVLDFFSGSATTAHAVMQLNADDGGNRKFIMVQLPEETDEKSEAYKACYKNICEIGKERIRRAGAKIKEEKGLDAVNLDTGFRVLKLDSSNMKNVYYNPGDLDFTRIDDFVDNIKDDRTPEDLLFQVMLELGVLPSSKIVETEIAGKKVFDVAENFLIACFDKEITEEVITEIANRKPYYFVMRDGSMATDSVATNFDQIFATYSPDTVRKVL